MDLTALANRRVSIWSDEQDLLFCFQATAAGGALVTYDADQAASLTALVADRLAVGEKSAPRLVLNTNAYLVVKTVSGTGDVHVKVVGDGE